MCNFAKSTSDTVVFSDPLPTLIKDDMYGYMSSLNRRLSRWCSESDVSFVDNWKSFWGRPGVRRDGVHPTFDGAALISRNLTEFLGTKNLDNLVFRPGDRVMAIHASLCLIFSGHPPDTPVRLCLDLSRLRD